MEIAIPPSQQLFESAISAARHATPTMAPDGLASFVGADLLGRVEEVWDSIETALRHAFQFGREKAGALLDAAANKAESLLTEAGQKAREVRETILQRLRMFTQALFEGLIAQMPNVVKIGSSEYVLKTVKLNQKLVATGSLKINLTEAFDCSRNHLFLVLYDHASADCHTSTPLTVIL
jgi:hypothetical protein